MPSGRFTCNINRVVNLYSTYRTAPITVVYRSPCRRTTFYQTYHTYPIVVHLNLVHRSFANPNHTFSARVLAIST